MSTFEMVILVVNLICFIVNLLTDSIKGMITSGFVFIAMLLLEIYQVVGGV